MAELAVSETYLIVCREVIAHRGDVAGRVVGCFEGVEANSNHILKWPYSRVVIYSHSAPVCQFWVGAFVGVVEINRFFYL